MNQIIRTISKTTAVAGGIAGLALLWIKGPEDPAYVKPRFETAIVTQKSHIPASEDWVFFDYLFLPIDTPARYDVTLRASDCEQTFNDKQLYDTTNLNSTVPVTVWDRRKILPTKYGALYVDDGCAIEPEKKR